MNLKNKVAIVTGGSNGIGEAIANKFILNLLHSTINFNKKKIDKKYVYNLDITMELNKIM